MPKPSQSRSKPRPKPAAAPEGAARLVVIVGPTASGKTSLGIELAERLGGEIVSADSQQVFKELDLGTAKPTPEERARARHHLIDFADPATLLSAGEFARLADEAIAGIRARKHLPIVVGGTGLWVRALLLGIVEAPAVDPALRRSLEERAAREGRQAMHAELARVDPDSAAAIPPQNLVFVLRALELFAQTGEKPSEMRARHSFSTLRYDAQVFGVSPPREELYRRIDQRTRRMFERGLVDEVRALVGQGRRAAAETKALGYPQALAVVDGRSTPQEAVAAAAQHTRHYAKRQLTWFRADPLVEWLDWPVDAQALAARLARLGSRGESG
ncbi:MAG TPA: tRNA (adenosine(37)-N6)-dimethylallyltransferase MiaA [Myxococcales bacterium]|jgi:tRNA dimethylallyltransferase